MWKIVVTASTDITHRCTCVSVIPPAWRGGGLSKSMRCRARRRGAPGAASGGSWVTDQRSHAGHPSEPEGDDDGHQSNGLERGRGDVRGTTLLRDSRFGPERKPEGAGPGPGDERGHRDD